MRPDAAAPRSGEFFAPIPLLALLVWVVNDVYLKAKFHNFITGKLSDVAVCFVMPLFVSEVLGLTLAWTPKRRLAFGAVFTAALFTTLEVVHPVSERAVALLVRIGPYLGMGSSFAMTSDITDLACVPIVLLAYRFGCERLAISD